MARHKRSPPYNGTARQVSCGETVGCGAEAVITDTLSPDTWKMGVVKDEVVVIFEEVVATTVDVVTEDTVGPEEARGTGVEAAERAKATASSPGAFKEARKSALRESARERNLS